MLFTADHDEPRRALQKFIAAEINPHVDEWEAAEIFPAHTVFKKLGDLGLLGLTAPEQYGGSNMGYLAHIVAMEEVSRGSARAKTRSPKSA